jgi:hypothetical protein
MLPGCLITQPVHFDPPANSPPSIIDGPQSAHPTTQIVQLTGDATPVGDAGMLPQFTLDVVVVEADVALPLSWRAYVDDVASPFDLGTLLPLSTTSMTRDHRPLMVPVPSALLATGTTASCHRVQLFVSHGFMDGLGHTPVVADDVAIATWWVLHRPDTSSSGPDMLTCPR